MVVDRFFIWVAEATSEQKLAAVDALVAAYFDARVAEADREALEAALMLVAEDPDPAVRRRLAEVLAEIDAAPRHLLLALLEDHPSIAVVVAARSEALIDAELVDLVAHGADEIRRAVARRRRVGPTVAAALAEAGDRTACVALLANAGAEIPPVALERLVERFGEFSEIRKALLARPHVPIVVRHRVLEKLSEAIETLVVVKSWMGPERAVAATRESREKATIALAGNATSAETVVLVEHLRRTGQLTTRVLLRAACIGDLRFVVEALALLADVPSSRVAALVGDGRESALRALHRRAGMPDRAWPAFHAAIEVHRELVAETGGLDGGPGDRARFARRLIERVLTRFTAFERRDADDLLVLLRRYAADAAREHVRHVMEERMADATRALAAPVVEPGIEAAAAAATIRPDLDAALASALATELGLGEAPDDADPDTETETESEVPVVAPAAEADAVADAVVAEPAVAGVDFAAAVGPAPFDLDLEETAFEGLFAHVRLEDLPPEWCIGEISPEALWGDEDVAVRRSLTPELRLVVDEDAAMPLRGATDDEAVARGVETAADVETVTPVDATVEDEAAEVVVLEASPVTPDRVEVAPAEAAPCEIETLAAPAAPAPAADPAPAVDPFFAELESALEGILGPLPATTRHAA